MTTATLDIERERLLKLAEEYKSKGYEILLHPNPEDLPDFLKGYRPDMIVRRGDEAVIIEVKSRSSFDSASTQYLRKLAGVVEHHSGWRFEFVMVNAGEMVNADETTDLSKTEGSLQKHEIKLRLQIARQLAGEYSESAILYSWSLVEATLRLVAEAEELSLSKFDTRYLVKKLTIEGVISQSEYQLLMKAHSLRNVIAHGFKTTEVTQNSVYELIDMAEQLLSALPIDDSNT